MSLNITIKSSLIAPCGMNCGLCLGYQRTKNKCAGCSSTSLNKPNYCISCPIKTCQMLSRSKSKYCYKYEMFPCKRIKNLDKRYRTKYGMSMIENLNAVKEIGIRKFVKLEKQKWTCLKCGNIICVHRNVCLVCGAKRIFSK
jgi:hypothetical protein